MTTRRELIKKTFLGFGAGIIASKSAPALAEMCIGATPAQIEGPFYPISQQLDSDNDLTYVKDSTKKAEGEVIFVTGVVADAACKPIKNALVEIWQACQTGKYNHPNDPNPAKVDPNFQYFGRCVTDAEGKYIFKTIRPGIYPADDNWMRPAHIHFKVHLKGFEELTTQMYFSDDPLNAADFIIKNIPKDERSRVIVDFSQKDPNGIPMGKFDVTLKKIITQ